jgi:hypothetical protein
MTAGGPGAPGGVPGSAAEQRVRAALAGGEPPAGGDVAAVLDELAQARIDAEERWQAITRLAPAAKRHRARAESQARAAERIGDHLDALERLAGEAPAPWGQAMRAWVAEARGLLAVDGAS